MFDEDKDMINEQNINDATQNIQQEKEEKCYYHEQVKRQKNKKNLG